MFSQRIPFDLQPSVLVCVVRLRRSAVRKPAAQDAIERLLAEQPNVAGLAVPGMPVGSPGMAVEGRENAPFDVLMFDASGQAEVFASYAR